ncbi:MAG: sugar phosphate isomerase/epimerase [Bryobacterales bacterium]|nr:sugar phosphate isomerase/epimerase [Bryobacterales bacterium]
MHLSRRAFLSTACGAAAGAPWAASAAGRFPGLKVGVTDWNLGKTGQLEAVSLAASLGFEGVEISFGRKPGGDRLPLDDAATVARYLEEARARKIAIAGTCLDILHVNCLKNDKLAQKWIADAIPVTAKLKARTILLPFFGKCSATTPQEMDYVGDALKELAREAERAKVVLALENTLSAEDNVRILDRTKSKALRIYYDVGNSTNAGFDPVREIRWLGRARICQIHLKDRGYLGEGRIDFPAVMKAIADIGFKGFAVLETSSPSKSIEADMKRNLAFVRKLMA